MGPTVSTVDTKHALYVFSGYFCLCKASIALVSYHFLDCWLKLRRTRKIATTTAKRENIK